MLWTVAFDNFKVYAFFGQNVENPPVPLYEHMLDVFRISRRPGRPVGFLFMVVASLSTQNLFNLTQDASFVMKVIMGTMGELSPEKGCYSNTNSMLFTCKTFYCNLFYIS